MAIELARTQALPRPWGVVDLRPWNKAGNDGVSIGEIWYERPGKPTSNPSLLLKLLFTSQPLSIQVHPDDAHARVDGTAERQDRGLVRPQRGSRRQGCPRPRIGG